AGYAGKAGRLTRKARGERRKRAMRRFATIMALCVALGACDTAKLESPNAPSTVVASPISLNANQRVTLLSTRGNDTSDLMDCLRNDLRSIPQVPADQFRSALFPWFEPGVTPTSAAELSELLHRKGVAETIRSLGVRYVVGVAGGTTITTTHWGEPQLA